MIEDAKRAWLATALEEGIPVPEPVPEDCPGKLVARMPGWLHNGLWRCRRRRRPEPVRSLYPDQGFRGATWGGRTESRVNSFKNLTQGK